MFLMGDSIMRVPFRFIAWTTWSSWALPLRVKINDWAEVVELQFGPFGVSVYYAPPVDWSDRCSDSCGCEAAHIDVQRDYRNLISAIRAGDGAAAVTLLEGDPLEATIVAAFNGSLDAARKVHDVLAPEWFWILQSDGEHYLTSPAESPDGDRIEVNLNGGSSSSGNSARD